MNCSLFVWSPQLQSNEDEALPVPGGMSGPGSGESVCQ